MSPVSPTLSVTPTPPTLSFAVLTSLDPAAEGNTYAVFENVETMDVDGVCHVDLVRSGVWSSLPAGDCDAPIQEVLDNEVTEAEAMDGAQTLLGKPICFAHENSDGNIAHTYGVVAHVTWDENNLQGVFDVATIKGTPLIRMISKTGMMHTVSLVNFCLRPMHNKSVMLFRRPMMIRTHLELDEAWDKIAKNAKRSTAATTNKILSSMPSGTKMPDESMLIPAYNFEQGVVWIPISRILDHSFYVLNGRSGKKLPESLFEALPVSVATAPSGLDDEVLVTPKRGRSKSHDEPLQPSQNKGKSKLAARKVVQFHSPVAQRAQKLLDDSLLSEFESGEDDEDLQDPMSDEDEDGLTSGFGSIGFAGMYANVPHEGRQTRVLTHHRPTFQTAASQFGFCAQQQLNKNFRPLSKNWG